MDGWFPRFSPDGRHVMRGSVVLSVDGIEVAGDAISGAWLSNDILLYRQHSTGLLRRLAAGMDDAYGPVCHQVVAGGGTWAAWHEHEGTPVVFTGDARLWTGYGGGMHPLAMAPDGTLVMGRHRDGVLCVVAPRGTVVMPLAEGRMPRCSHRSVVWERDGHIFHADLQTRVACSITVPGEQCYGPVLIDTPEGEWVLTHTGSERLLLFPRDTHVGYIVTTGITMYPDAVWTAQGIRVAWSDGAGAPGEVLIDLNAPHVPLSAQLPVWHPAGTTVDTLPFLVPNYLGTLRSEDGQTLQSVRTGPREVCCLKGSPERQERWRWDDEAIYLTYDASDKPSDEPIQPWRVDPEPVWCDRIAYTATRISNGPESALIRRRPDGTVTREHFPVQTGVHAIGEHIAVPKLGLCRILVTTWAPHRDYEERHWWAIRESDELRLGRVRYEEWRYAGEWQFQRGFWFNELTGTQLVPAAPLPIVEKETNPMIAFPPRDETLAFTTALNDLYRDAMQRPAQDGIHVDLEGLAVWQQEYLRLRVNGMSHTAALEATLQEVRYAAGLDPRPR